MRQPAVRDLVHDLIRLVHGFVRSCPARFGLAPGLALALIAFGVTPARAWVEEVLVTHAGTDDAVVERASGERLWLDVHQDCLPLRGRVGWTILIWSAEPAVSTQSRLLVPDLDLSCPIWQVDTLARAKPLKSAQSAPTEGLLAMRQSLELLGLDCGPPGQAWSPDVAQAFLRFREGKRLDASPQGLRRAVTSLALDVMRGRQATGTSQRLARIISDQLDPLVAFLLLPGDSGARCGAPTWVRSIAEQGALVTLADGTRWQPAATLRALVTRWQDGDEVVVCTGRLVNARTGELARATRLE
jgi:hypothetical protein